MKVSIRQGVFETNSSSVHTLTMCSDSEYKKWENGELLYGKYSEVFITREEYEANQEKYDSDDDYKSYDDYFNDYDMETYDESYKTPGGEIVHAFGRYGYDS